MSRSVRFTALMTGILLGLILAANDTPAQTPLTTVVVDSSFTSPTYLCALPGDTSRLFVLEQVGRVRIIKNGTVLAQPFLNIQSKVTSGGERGLLGMAFHPDYDNNGYFYVSYTGFSPTGRSIIERYQVSATNPDSANPNSDFEIFTQVQPQSNHNGGMIAFGPDGYLYFGLGDGGGAGDTPNNAQTRTTLLGKMIRLDVDGGSPYAIPPDNPFVGDTTTLDEIWAIGVRNPWRYSFDRQTGDLWIADVGQGAWEEVNFEEANSGGGFNYGWRLKEGDSCYNPASGCDTLVGLTDPISAYSHALGCSITGGYVYRGCAIPDLAGTYFFGDYCSGRVWSYRYENGNLVDSTQRTSELDLPGFGIVSFGEDALGELYIVYSDGLILKIVPDGVPSQCNVESCCSGPSVGNVDGSLDNEVTLGDLTIMIDHLFVSLDPLDCPEEGNLDESPDGEATIADLTVMIDHLFITLAPLPPCPA